MEARELAARLEELADHLVATPAANAPPGRASSLRNLEHYLAFRQHDLRELQQRLAALGLSSLGRSESNVLGVIEATLAAACALAGRNPPASRLEREGVPAAGRGQETLTQATERLFGPAPDGRSTRIMVTLPTEAATDRSLVRSLVTAGVDAVRINTAHDDPPTWRAMVAAVRAEQRPARPVMVMFDLAGPKLRTGPLQPGPEVERVRPRRDRIGVVVEPARRWLVPPGCEVPGRVGSGWWLPVDRPLDVVRGDVIELVDARGARRKWNVVAQVDGVTLIEAERTAYVTSGLALCRQGEVIGHVGRLAALPLAWEVTAGDLFWLTSDLEPADPSQHRIGCSLPEVLDHVNVGDRVGFDDGRAWGVVERLHPGEVAVRITSPEGHATKLRPGKGINLPDSVLGLAALTEADRAALAVAVEVADAVSLSFVSSPEDVADLQEALAAAGRPNLGVVAKVETRRAFDALPAICRQLMASERCGVMIARGDLAVELGYERLAEVQEEVLWLAEAAHLPVIWATEVLDALAKSGAPTRAEITDAAVADRAECVMLNKGPHIVAAVKTLADILSRMDGHVAKKQALLRRLRTWGTATSCSPR